MISKISLFNKGIYKSTLRRYLWGSVLYFILLFMITGMSIMLSYGNNRGYLPMQVRDWPLILDNEYIILPMLLAIVVPTVAGLLIFRFIHSKKASVFVHSLPVKREANFISSVLAALTLMAIPVILNTLVLMIISASGYSNYFGIGDCAVWMLWNLFGLFIMFSCVCFVASVTGNSFAMVVLNVLFHCFVPLLAAGFSIVAEKFLHGYAGDNELINRVIDNNFPARLMSVATGLANRSETYDYTGIVVKFAVISIVLYILSALLCKKRRMETAEDVAGFRCLNPIFKYLVTFMGATTAFSVFSNYIADNPFMFWGIVALVSIVIYFASEMLLKKTLRVWRTYKGCIGFAAAFAAMMCVFAFTSFFGFENYIPKNDSISEVAVYNYYHKDRPYTGNEEVAAKALILHHNMISDKHIIKKYTDDTNIHIEYKLKNGKTLHRRYGISRDKLHDTMESLYKTEEYKTLSEKIFTPMKSIYSINIYSGNEHVALSTSEQMAELVECITEDTRELSYNRIYSNGWDFNVQIEYLPTDEDINKDNYRIRPEENGERSRIYIDYISVDVNINYKRTVEWLRKNGYWDKIAIQNTGVMYVCKSWEELPFVDEEKNGKVELDKEKEERIIKIEAPEDIKKMIEYAHSVPQEYIKKNDSYTLYQLRDRNSLDYSVIMTITKEEVLKLFPDRGWEKKF